MRMWLGEQLLRWRWGAVCWVLILSLIAFVLMGWGKRKARQGQWRVPERTLFLTALLGGSPGAMLGMYWFHHKTRHWYFRWGLPALLLIQAAGAAWLLCGTAAI